MNGKRLGLSESSDERCIAKGLPRGGVWGGDRAGVDFVTGRADLYFVSFWVFFSRFFSGGQKGVQRWSQASQMAPKSHPKSPKIMKK